MLSETVYTVVGWVVWEVSAGGVWNWPRESVVRCALREVVWILYVDGISMCLCIDLRGYVRILGAPSAPSGCTLGMSASY